MVLFGIWDGRFDSEDHLVAHFLKWYSLAVVSAWSSLIWWARMAAWTAVGVALSATFTAELARADALSLFALSIVLALPAICGGLCLKSVLKRVTLPDQER